MSTGVGFVTVWMWAIFVATYAGIAFGGVPFLVVDRSGVAVLGAIAMLVTGGVTLDQAAHSIDKPTMVLLFGLMLLASQLRLAGFPLVVDRLLEKFLAKPRSLLAMVILVSAVVSALLANDIVCLAFTPLLCRSLLRGGRDPLPYLLGLATSSNVGSALTIIGNPQNMYIGSVAHLPFGAFSLVMLVPVAFGLAVCWGVIVVLMSKQLSTKTDPGGAALVEQQSPEKTEIDRFLIIKTFVLVAALVAFFFYAGANADLRAVGAICAAGLLLVSRRPKSARLQESADWNLLLLFIGLFVVNGAMQQRQLIQSVFEKIASAGVRVENLWTLTGVTTILSNLVSNVPAVLLLQPKIASGAGGGFQRWYLLSLVSTLAGNLTLLGSIANLIVAESAGRFSVKINLWTYCKVGIPITLITVAAGAMWVIYFSR